MVESRIAWENGLAEVDLAENAANGPHINRFCIFTRPKKDFRSAVPSRGHIFGHYRLRYGLIDGGDGPGEPKICEFGEAIGVEENIGGLEISMDEFSGVHVLDAFQYSFYPYAYW